MTIYTLPETYEKLSDRYAVTCEGKPLSVVETPVSAFPLNQVWPGYQRPLEQTEPTCFVSLGVSGPFTLVITPSVPFETVTVRPTAKHITPTVKDGSVTVDLPGVGQYSVEFDGMHEVLTVFADPEKDFGIDKTAGNVIYFGKGVSYLDAPLALDDGAVVYLDKEAVVYGAIVANEKKNVRVCGCGILDNSLTERGKGAPMQFVRCENVSVEGVTVVDSSAWSMHYAGCTNVVVDNIKLIGMWRYNSDGCDFTNCTNAVLKNSYLRNFDDCVVVKGLAGNGDQPVRNISVEHCVLWCDWGRALEIGAETVAPYMTNIRFCDIDVIHGDSVMLDLQHGDRAEISDVTFENVRVEYMAKANAPVLQTVKDEKYVNPDETYMPRLFVVSVQQTMWSHDKTAGNIRGVRFKDIAVYSEDGRVPVSKGEAVTAGGTVVPNGSVIYADPDDSTVEDVRFENITVNGVRYTDLDSLHITVGKNVKGVSIE